MRELLANLMTVAGLAAVGVGLWWIYPPACLIGVGAVVCVAGYKASVK